MSSTIMFKEKPHISLKSIKDIILKFNLICGNNSQKFLIKKRLESQSKLFTEKPLVQFAIMFLIHFKAIF